jgi:hypothetical protein
MPSFISPQFTDETFGEHPTLDEKIRIFEDREYGWRLNVAESMDQIAHAGYGIISVLFPYFEMLEQFTTGQTSHNQSRAFFRRGVRRVYPQSQLTDAQLDAIYDRVRCGMYHDGYTRFGTLISGNYPAAIAMEHDTVLINPGRLRYDLVTHFASYIEQLRDTANQAQRTNFEAIFDAGTTP